MVNQYCFVELKDALMLPTGCDNSWEKMRIKSLFSGKYGECNLKFTEMDGTPAGKYTFGSSDNQQRSGISSDVQIKSNHIKNNNDHPDKTDDEILVYLKKLKVGQFKTNKRCLWLDIAN